MEFLEMNISLVQRLMDWDPLGYGEDSYETEIADTIQAVHVLSSPNELARKIQSIYEFSFEEVIPLSKCTAMAEELLAIKNESTCSL
ncbi:DUF1871 family protein [Robertmurraya korlensis]|jgi:hypothetical protein|uniref:DUF1871 family protein n=1 Tax=Robertmurraya korlensis TaxID=519977 RepID=UPI0008250498|nr:DUF1871 family protein [Robertmurraya korlensis]